MSKKSNFGELKNTELIFIFFIIKDVLNTYNQVIEQRGVTNKLTLPDGSFLESFKALDEEEIEEITSSKRYHYINNISNKLSNVSTLIQESFPNLYKEIEDMFVYNEESKDFLL